ncbi:MAG TPA: hypothetical protein VGF34_08790 [Stellaceae bacterium]|jgi:hypothetical protein
MFSHSDLDELVAIDAEPAISLFLSTHAAGREIRQDPIRLKNLLSDVAERLKPARRSPAIETLLAPAARLVDDEAFWQHQRGGLAIFLAPDFARIHQLPAAVAEELVVGTRFHIKPLLPLVVEAGPFWLLCLSARRARLYHGTRRELTEASGLDLPAGVDQIRGETEYQEGHYAGPGGRRGGYAKAQSFGPAPDEIRKTELLEMLRRVVTVVEPEIRRKPAPVVLAASSELRGHFREIAGWKEILSDGLDENPDRLRDEELHRAAYALVDEKCRHARKAAVERFNSRIGTGQATTKPADIVRAARYARIDTLFLCGDEHLWGRFDEAADRIVAHQSPVEGDIDLLDDAAVMTLRHGGEVMLVDRQQLPPPGLVGALLRY